MIDERDIEQYLVRAVEENGGQAWKFVSPGRNGVPDRILLFPGGVMAFVETKKPGEGLRSIQQRRVDELKKLGFAVCVVDSKERADELVEVLHSESFVKGGTEDEV